MEGVKHTSSNGSTYTLPDNTECPCGIRLKKDRGCLIQVHGGIQYCANCSRVIRAPQEEAYRLQRRLDTIEMVKRFVMKYITEYPEIEEWLCQYGIKPTPTELKKEAVIEAVLALRAAVCMGGVPGEMGWIEFLTEVDGPTRERVVGALVDALKELDKSQQEES